MLGYFLHLFVGSSEIEIDCCDVAFNSFINSTETTGLESPIDSDEIVGLESLKCPCEVEKNP